LPAVRIIAKRTLRTFWNRPGCRDAEKPLTLWYAEARRANWTSPATIKARYRRASFLAGNRVVFDIAGNRYRLVVKVNFDFGIVYVRFVGTHAEYDAIDAGSI
jgi:mRNA interferase HigB